MNNTTLLRCLGLGLVAMAGLVGCASPEPIEGVELEEFPEESGQVAAYAAQYPAGPYGIGKGSVVKNYQLIGFANASVNLSSMQMIQFSDFYNPHADDPGYAPAEGELDDRLFPPGSPYGEGQPKPRALVIQVASVWCGPCNYEADQIVPVEHAKYKPCGGEFLLQLADGKTGGVPATPEELIKWTTKYEVNFPATIDPSYKIGELFSQNAYPANMIIDTRTMTIVKVIAGVPDDSFWTTFENTLNNDACLAGQ